MLAHAILITVQESVYLLQWDEILPRGSVTQTEDEHGNHQELVHVVQEMEERRGGTASEWVVLWCSERVGEDIEGEVDVGDGEPTE